MQLRLTSKIELLNAALIGLQAERAQIDDKIKAVRDQIKAEEGPRIYHGPPNASNASKPEPKPVRKRKRRRRSQLDRRFESYGYQG